jgi:hypothetical protein
MKRQQKKIDPLNIFTHANRFRIANERLRSSNDADEMAIMSGPAIVLSSFSSELFLKCFHCIDSGQVPHGHELYTLFNTLPSIRQNRLEHFWDYLVSKQAKSWDICRRIRSISARIKGNCIVRTSPIQ